MSASIPDTKIAPGADVAVPSTEASAKVVQLPLDDTARRRQESSRVNRELRNQLALLSQHYAEDSVRTHEALKTATSNTERATRELTEQRRYSAGIEAALFEARGDLRFIRERLSQERRRAARLAEIARLPWWAFSRRRWSLDAIAADDGS